MDIHQAAKKYLAEVKGFQAKDHVTSQEESQKMQKLVTMAEASDVPADGFTHLNRVYEEILRVAPQSAALFRNKIISNPDPQKQKFAKTLEAALEVIAQRSPETWEHIQHHTALTMLYYEKDNGSSVSKDPNTQLTLLVAALGHDIGKIAIDPSLLHKSTRIDPKRFAEALESYKQNVSDDNYNLKLHDILFLQEANNGKIAFNPSTVGTTYKGDEELLDIGNDSVRRAEQGMSSPEEESKYNAIWHRIQQKAQNIPGWLNAEEQAALIMPGRRGTVTGEEMKVIAAHDAMSEAFFNAANVPKELQNVHSIVSMDRFREEGKTIHQAMDPLADTIHATDIFESLTGHRNYRTAATVEEALAIMHNMSSKGEVNADIFQRMQTNGTLSDYSAEFGVAHNQDIIAQANLAASLETPNIRQQIMNKIEAFAQSATNLLQNTVQNLKDILGITSSNVYTSGPFENKFSVPDFAPIQTSIDSSMQELPASFNHSDRILERRNASVGNAQMR